MTGKDIPLFSELKPHLDLDSVSYVIAHYTPERSDNPDPTPIFESRLSSADLEDAARLVWHAAETWLGTDYIEFANIRTETRHVLAALNSSEPPIFRSYLDVIGTLRGLIAPFKDFPAATFVLDWKTRDGILSDDWRHKQIMSWQWQQYSHLTDAAVFIYRGISRRITEARTVVDRAACTKQVIIRVPTTNTEQVLGQLQGVQNQALALHPLSVWPQNRPEACNSYGRECNYYEDCDNFTMPQQRVHDVPRSYSAMKAFLLCPERYRRDAIAQEAQDSPQSLFGSAFHRGAACLWQQLGSVKL